MFNHYAAKDHTHQVYKTVKKKKERKKEKEKKIFSVWRSSLILNQIFIINAVFSAEYEYDIYFPEK